VNTAPHFGHFTFASFDTPAHPNDNTAKIASAMMMLTNFLITSHLLSPHRLQIPVTPVYAGSVSCYITQETQIAKTQTVVKKKIYSCRFIANDCTPGTIASNSFTSS
jgi:hypothetical protein